MKNDIMGYKRDLTAVREKMEALNNKAASEKRDFTRSEQTEWDGYVLEANRLGRAIEAEMAGSITVDPSSLPVAIRGEWRDGEPRQLAEGEIRTFRHNERIAPTLRSSLPDGIEARELSWSRMIRGIVTGNWVGAEAEQRTTGLSGSGTNVVPTPLAAEVIDLARNKSRVMQAGALTVPMESSTLKIGKLTADPTAYWRAEHAAITASDPTFAVVTLTAKTLGVLVRCSVEWLEDAQNGPDLIQNAISNALSLELDRVGLVGSGTGAEPKGMMTATGVNEISMGTNGAAITSYAPFSQAVADLYEANGEPTAVIYAPRTWQTLDMLVDTTDQPLRPPASYEGLTKLVSNQVPIDQDQGTAENASAAFLGGFENVLYGMRTGITLEAVRTGEADAFSKMDVLIRGYLRADVQLARANHLARIIGIIPAS